MVNKEFFDVLSKNINYIKINDDIFSGGTFEIKKYKHKFSSTTDESNKLFYDDDVINEKILYQSNPELQLIEFCNKMNIVIKNGPKVKYFFNNKIRTYFIDYYIPTKKVIIEIKDNHIWHKNQIDSGQWKMKEETAKKYAKDNGLRYKLIFTQYLQEFLDTF